MEEELAWRESQDSRWRSIGSSGRDVKSNSAELRVCREIGKSLATPPCSRTCRQQSRQLEEGRIPSRCPDRTMPMRQEEQKTLVRQVLSRLSQCLPDGTLASNMHRWRIAGHRPDKSPVTSPSPLSWCWNDGEAEGSVERKSSSC